MAVYTSVSEDSLTAFLNHYNLGGLQSYQGIEQGVSNTNYHLYTDTGHYILTLFEPHRVHADDIPFFLAYSDCMAAAGIPCPAVMKDKNGESIRSLHDRPAVIFEFLAGEGGHAGMITPDVMREVGMLVARMHNAAAADMIAEQDNHFGLKRWGAWLEAMGPLMDKIAPGLYGLCRTEYDLIASQWPADLPRGAVHADLFPDNVFFNDGNVSGVIDFHFVCTDYFVYDLAIIANAWCFDTANVFRAGRYDALMGGYEAIRPLTDAEKYHLPMFLRAGSMRFLLSRAEEFLNHTPDKLMKPHDPVVFLTRLKHFQSHG